MRKFRYYVFSGFIKAFAGAIDKFLAWISSAVVSDILGYVALTVVTLADVIVRKP